ncbi:hypothetical protein AAGG74_15840 [Bacillus mexicanus]|uniref:hypothetical protein n=1 Tax=Bacillus mexicanus TaxID=2834415 RepID=UPI003D2068E9
MDRTIRFAEEIEKYFNENQGKLNVDDLNILKRVAKKLKSGELTLRDVTKIKAASVFNENVDLLLIEAYNKAVTKFTK